jgi:superfamily II DNA/RNA helicase
MKASQNSADAAKKKSGGGFQSYNLSPPVFKAIQQKGYSLPTPI